MPLVINLKTFFQDFFQLDNPRLECPWCGYNDAPAGFHCYNHPWEPITKETGSMQCGLCLASGYTALFILAANPTINLGQDEQYRAVFLGDLAKIQRKEKVGNGSAGKIPVGLGPG